jgi:hypothetical protein
MRQKLSLHISIFILFIVFAHNSAAENGYLNVYSEQSSPYWDGYIQPFGMEFDENKIIYDGLPTIENFWNDGGGNNEGGPSFLPPDIDDGIGGESPVGDAFLLVVIASIGYCLFVFFRTYRKRSGRV